MSGRILTDDDARAIFKDPRDARLVARDWRISCSLVYQIRNGRIRPHIRAELTSPEDLTIDWRPVEGYPLYEVNSSGDVRNVRSKKLLRHRPNPSGYPVVDLHTGKRFGLSNETKQVTKLVHVLVCTAFRGPQPSPLHEVAHNNGDPSNPEAGNLRWATRPENHADKKIHGTEKLGEDRWSAKLTEAQAISILNDERSATAIAADHKISPVSVWRIKSGQKWKHLHTNAETAPA